MAKPLKPPIEKQKTLHSSGNLTIGLDLGDKKSHYCVLDKDGMVIEESSIPTDPASMEKHFRKYPSSLVALEVSTHSRWVSQLLQRCGHEALVANPNKVKLISKNNRKNDRTDARTLARLARADRELLHPIQHRSEDAQAVLALLQMINCVRGLVKPTGHRLPHCTPPAFAKRMAPLIPHALHAATMRVLDQIKMLTETIREYDKSIEALAREQHPESRLLTQVTGVGSLTALAFMMTLGDKHRFARSRQVGCYIGLKPKQRQSGDKDPQLGIGKDGDNYLRKLLGAVFSLHSQSSTRLRFETVGLGFEGSRR
jgi:transposase